MIGDGKDRRGFKGAVAGDDLGPRVLERGNAAATQTLLGTARLNGLDPAAWLKDTLARLPVWPNSRIDELLPLAPEFIEALKQK